MSVSRIPTIRAKVARQAQLVRRLALETAAPQIPGGQMQSGRRLTGSLGAPAALLLSIFHLTPAAAKAPDVSPPAHNLSRGESTVVYYEH